MSELTTYDESHRLFRDSFRQFLQREVVPNHKRWEALGIVDRDLFKRAGGAGFLGFAAPARWGGGDTPDFLFNAIMNEENVRHGVHSSAGGLTLQSDICLPYFLHAASDSQRDRWLPGICAGDLITAIAMTEPGAGSDLAAMRTTAVREGDDYVINGSKIFISNGLNCDLVILACKTDLTQSHRGISLIVVETDSVGVRRGRNLEKMGLHAQDTAELFFDDVRVPASNLLGEEGSGFAHLMRNLPQERLQLAVVGQAFAETALNIALEYARTREAFGQPIGSFQHNRFLFATHQTEIDMGRVYLDHLIARHNTGGVSAEDAAKAKWWCTELCKRVVDSALQIHGGAGYMEEYPIAGIYRDTRILTIVGGTTEIMKEIIGRSMRL